MNPCTASNPPGRLIRLRPVHPFAAKGTASQVPGGASQIEGVVDCRATGAIGGRCRITSVPLLRSIRGQTRPARFRQAPALPAQHTKLVLQTATSRIDTNPQPTRSDQDQADRRGNPGAGRREAPDAVWRLQAFRPAWIGNSAAVEEQRRHRRHIGSYSPFYTPLEIGLPSKKPLDRKSAVNNNFAVVRGGIEPPTHGFSVRCSTN
jgi:hypothetical protein